MVEIKSYEFVKIPIRKLLSSYFIFIFYGSDNGLISELIDQFEKKNGISHKDPFSFVVLNSFELQKNPETLWNEIDSIGLFDQKKLILINNVSTEKIVLNCLEEIALNNINNHIIVIRSPGIKKDSLLLKLGKKFTSILSISCYPDNKINLMNLIKEELSSKRQQVSADAEQILIENLGGDRISSRNELQKLSSYCLEDLLITAEHVKGIISDTHNLYIEEIIDSVTCGDIYNAILMVDTYFSSKMSPHAILHGLLKRFQLLDTIYTETEYLGTSLFTTIQKYEKTRIEKKRILLQQSLKIWDKNTIKIFIHKIDQEIQLTRTKSILEKSIIAKSILYIAQLARKKAKNI
ncbi:MAG: DNA polymerase III subunit delta [Candidatus Liberibacter ctenarytainae]|uniref:DNA polymerase III subunit delta n=1 Tax=Candidatus Liberibacter ctenarytainae TaxID=2020335 RepID=A0A937DGS0_9HYPH|nr:DNA polymerase III subunit delta [Candidatus Liberibacter ctenarytainae]